MGWEALGGDERCRWGGSPGVEVGTLALGWEVLVYECERWHGDAGSGTGM